MVLFFLTLS